MPTTQQNASRGAPELVWLGDGAWVACDEDFPRGDPRRVIAYVECKDHLVYVLPARDSAGVRTYDTIREALADLTAALPARVPA